MTNRAQNESLSRLETLRNAWDFDALQHNIDLGAPVLRELGLEAEVQSSGAGASAGLESLRAGPAPRLEAIIRAVGRPPLLVRSGPAGPEVLGKSSLPIGEEKGLFPPTVEDHIRAVEPHLQNVGRIQFYNADMRWGGTGWVFDREDDGTLVIITNRHVARIVARRTWRGDAVFLLNSNTARRGASVDFFKEDQRMDDTSRDIPIERFTYIAEDLAADIALARLKGPAADSGFAPEPLCLAAQDPSDHDLIGICGYPAADGGRNDRTEMERYFQGLYDVKRFSPGYIIHPRAQDTLSHDATTTGGSSGSPVILLRGKNGAAGEVVGLHFAGQYGVENSAVRVSTLRALKEEGRTGAVMGGGVPTEGRDGAHDPAHFDGRTGYDPDFLQVLPVPMPRPNTDIPLSKPTDARDDQDHELRYQHFSVLYAGVLKLPVLTALNIDGAQTQAVKDYGRWHKDLRVPAAEQLSQAEYGHDDIDRGHMVRRAATNWGATEAVANLSNRDSYHYTIAAPQHRSLNRNWHTWLGLENHIMNSARTHRFRASVFTGPVLGDDDPQLGETGAPVPGAFFKMVVMAATLPDDPEVQRLHATAYVLSQGQLIANILSDRGRVETVEGFVFGAFKTFQIPVRALEQQTGHDFGPLRDFDPMERIEAAPAAIHIEDLRQIRL